MCQQDCVCLRIRAFQRSLLCTTWTMHETHCVWYSSNACVLRPVILSPKHTGTLESRNRTWGRTETFMPCLMNTNDSSLLISEQVILTGPLHAAAALYEAGRLGLRSRTRCVISVQASSICTGRLQTGHLLLNMTQCSACNATWCTVRRASCRATWSGGSRKCSGSSLHV